MELVKKMGISERLQEERKDLGLTQEAMAGKLGATKRSVINWEGGAALPGAEVLAGYAAAGADVLYILTGQRTEGTASDPAEQVLLDSYRRCKPDAKANLIQMAALLSAGVDAAPQKRASAVQVGNLTSTHDGAVQVGYAGGNVRVGKK